MPLITYLQRREDGEHIVIPPSVYEERRTQYEHRIQSMIDYATGQTECRSVSLLRYFGEREAKPCGQCDVCLSRKRVAPATAAEACERIKALLADGKGHPVTALHALQLPKKVQDEALDHLLKEEEVVMSDGLLFLGSEAR